MSKELLKNPWDLIEELASDEAKENFELDDILVGISLKLINYRINNNITQKELANILGISQAMISKLESGDYNPSIEQLWKISKKLGWKFEVVFEDTAQETNIWDTDDFEFEITKEAICTSQITEEAEDVLGIQYAEGA
ncbi:MAG TPA: helix-turn-helix transcriptional regulator [Patescibacteria group bacterium]|nr:helix-turn-helix transcriptional regulator [Patescibacteria group bacterium]